MEDEAKMRTKPKHQYTTHLLSDIMKKKKSHSKLKMERKGKMGDWR